MLTSVRIQEPFGRDFLEGIQESRHLVLCQRLEESVSRLELTISTQNGFMD